MGGVFIGSTSRDLHDYRRTAIETCNRLGLSPIAMEFFDSMGPGAVAASKLRLHECDVYVGIFAHRYGYVEQGHDRSVTEIEFDYAGELGRERLCFELDPSHPWPPDAIDYAQRDRLEQFKERMRKSVVRSQFTTIEDFNVKLTHSLVQWQHDLRPLAPESALPWAASAPAPALVVGRGRDLHEIRSRLTPGSRTIVRGWPGVGKTTTVSALARDPKVVSNFPDGVLWASLGESPDVLSELRRWAQALGITAAVPQALPEAMALVRGELEERTSLLIVDDVWEAADAAPFQVTGPKSVTIFTTRFRDVASNIARSPGEIYWLGQLGEAEAIELLSRLAPRATAGFPAESRQLVRELEGLPLALRVAGRLLENDFELGFDVAGLFAALGRGDTLLSESAPDDRYDTRTRTLPSVSALLEQSTNRLDETTRDRFAYLGAMAPKPATFDLAAMEALWLEPDPKPTARKLADRGLLEPLIGTGRFQMHALLVAHARSLLTA